MIFLTYQKIYKAYNGLNHLLSKKKKKFICMKKWPENKIYKEKFVMKNRDSHFIHVRNIIMHGSICIKRG